MGAPTASEITPIDGDTLADIDDISVIWTPDISDPIDITMFDNKKGITSYPTNYVAMPAGVFKAYANVELFPEDTNITVTFEAKSMSGALASVSSTFDCRKPYVIHHLTEMKNMPLGGVRMIASLHDSGLGMVGDRGAISLNSRPSISTPQVKALINVFTLVGAFDSVQAHITSTRPFLDLLTFLSQAVSLPLSEQVLSTVQAENGFINVGQQVFETKIITNFITNVIMYASIADVPVVIETLITLGISRDVIYQTLISLEIAEGIGIEAYVDIIDTILDQIRN